MRNFAAQLWALRDRVQVGDYVVMPLKGTPHLAIGKAKGRYEHRADVDPALRRGRPVEWFEVDVPRLP